MRKNNLAVYECPKGTGGLHLWRLRKDGTAVCINCELALSKADTADCYEGFNAQHEDQR